MRLLGIESSDVIVTVESSFDSDDEDDIGKEESEIWGIDLNEEDEYVNEDDDDEEDASVTIPLCWDSLQLDDLGINNEEFEWEEVDGDDEREVLSVLDDNNSEEEMREKFVIISGVTNTEMVTSCYEI